MPAKYLDLTLTIPQDTPSFPGSPVPQFIPWSSLETDGYNLELLFLSSHTGTHMDAPAHFFKNGAGIHRIPVERFCGYGILIRMERGADQTITRKDLRAYESGNGQIPAGSSVFFYTGWQRHLKKGNYFEENPGLSESAARYLAGRSINLVGTDSPSIDAGRNKKFPAHRILAENNILIVENLANLELIPVNPFGFAIMPLKLHNASGSPVRAVAFS